MKRFIILPFFIASFFFVKSQISTVNTTAEKIKNFINSKHADSIYALAAPVFSKAISKEGWKKMAEENIFIMAPITVVTTTSKNNYTAKYILQTAVGKVSMLLITDKNGLIEGLQFPPYTENTDIKIPETPQEILNESTAAIFENFYSSEQADSLAALMDDNFYTSTGMTIAKYKNVFVSQLFQYGPIVERSFIKSSSNISKYKCILAKGLTLQLFIQANEKQKIITWGMQPFKDDAAPKKASFESDNKKLSILDTAVDAIMKPYMLNLKVVGACVGVYYKGQSIFYHYGEIKRDSKILPDNNTLFEIGSISKTFTSILLADAIIREKIKLDDPITKYLPDSVISNKALEGITIKQLSNHTSGLPRLPDNFGINNTNAKDPYKDYDVKLMMSALKTILPSSAPGTKYAYSNFAPALLCTILEKINKQSFEEMLQTRIAKTMGLKNTHTFLLPTNNIMAATTYDEEGKETNRWNFKAFAGAGSIMSNVKDMLQYGIQNLKMQNNKLTAALKLAHKITFDEDPNTVALGWHYYTANTSKFKVLQHSGGTYGSLSHLAILKEKELVVVILTNNSAGGDAAGVNLLQKLDAVLK